MHDIADRSFLVSFVIHAVCLLTLAHTAPEMRSTPGRPITLSCEQGDSDGPEPLVAPLVEWHADVSDSAAQQERPTDYVGDTAFAVANTQVPLLEPAPLITAADALFETRPVEEIPGALVLLADASGFLAQQRASGGLPVGNEGDGDGGTSFFGIRDSGHSVAYVVDCSSSMAGPPLARLKKELFSSLAQLSPATTFTVIFFNDRAISLHERPCLLRATAANRTTAMSWIREIPAAGGTEPSTALSMALQLKPSVVFLMTDGQFAFPFPDATMALLKNKEQSRARINTVAFGQRAAAQPLQAIAKLTDGHFASAGP